ncbi:putative membrane protein [Halorhabdus sp. SVX81]|nr:putative membrane protein [Halorhabdus sp. SVX81]
MGSVATAVVIVLAIPSLAFGDGLITLKYALFVVGFLLFGVGSFAIQPTPHGRGPISRLFSMSLDGGHAFGFEQRIQKLPPLDGRQVPLEDRVSRGMKVFVTSLVVIGVSIFLEVGLGVAVN